MLFYFNRQPLSEDGRSVGKTREGSGLIDGHPSPPPSPPSPPSPPPALKQVSGSYWDLPSLRMEYWRTGALGRGRGGVSDVSTPPPFPSASSHNRVSIVIGTVLQTALPLYHTSNNCFCGRHVPARSADAGLFRDKMCKYSALCRIGRGAVSPLFSEAPDLVRSIPQP